MNKKSNLCEFRTEFERMMLAYNLGDYDVSFKENHLEENDAELIASASTRVAIVTLSTVCQKDRVKLAARHEAAHLFLRKLAELALNRHTTEAQLDDEEERLCTVLEKREIN